jgi:hypothetical protein
MQTLDYDRFKFFDFNRAIGKKIKRLKESIKKHGYISGRPILVDKQMRIIDGQHRFIACKELGMPIIYETIKSNGMDMQELVVDLNRNQKAWGIGDYIHSWASKGVRFHMVVKDFEEKYGLGWSPSVACCLARGQATGNSTRRIRDGKDIALNGKRERCWAFITSCNDLPFYKSISFVNSIVRLVQLVEEDELAVVVENRLSIPHCANAGQYLRVFENMINKYRKDSNRISLGV